ncbi:MAG: superoxide dismutase [bacterium]
MMNRREALRTMAFTSAATLIAANLPGAAARAADPAPVAPPPDGPFLLPPLPFAYDALEPYIDATTMQIHHGKHHAAYVQNLNKAVAGHGDLSAKSVDDLVRDLAAVPEDIRTAVRNHGGGHSNHSLFWKCLSKEGGGEPEGQLAEALARTFGDYARFKESLSKATKGVFGSGWAWLSLAGGELVVETTPNQDSPLSAGHTPLLGIDVWEHAYYLKYQNRRPDYIEAFYNVIDWQFVGARYIELQNS